MLTQTFLRIVPGYCGPGCWMDVRLRSGWRAFELGSSFRFAAWKEATTMLDALQQEHDDTFHFVVYGPDGSEILPRSWQAAA